MRPPRLLLRYVAGLTSAWLFTLGEVVAIVAALAWSSVATPANGVALAVIGTVGTAIVTGGAVAILAPSVRWLDDGRTPTPAEVSVAAKTMRRQVALTLAPWVLAAAILVPLNRSASVDAYVVVTSAIMFGAIATVCTGFLFTLRAIRPLLSSVPAGTVRPVAVGVRSRLLITWVVCTGLPGSAIAVLLALRSNDWLLLPSAPIELAVFVLTLVAVVLGFRAIMVVSMSISDPVGEVVAAMADVEKGNFDREIEVYEWSEIGRLQSGFNSMVAGLRERNLLRDLFGRHVGEEVAQRAVEQSASLSGDERDVAVLFIDLVDSTRLAVDREPHEVAAILNDFFRLVVAAVDDHEGLINKFQGDAALAVFGAPLRIDAPAAAALATARSLAAELRALPVDFGAGVSAGPVFAGNIGAANRYEYTVVGDAVNEAARLADRAKEGGERILCSGAVYRQAPAEERQHWTACGEALLRGRTEPTQLYRPESTDA